MKNDDNAPATKKDIKDLQAVTQKDIGELGDKISNVETSFQRSLNFEVSRLDDKIDKLEAKVDNGFDNVMTQLDKMSQILENLDIDREVGAHQTRELEEKVDNHEIRIAALESHTV